MPAYVIPGLSPPTPMADRRKKEEEEAAQALVDANPGVGVPILDTGVPATLARPEIQTEIPSALAKPPELALPAAPGPALAGTDVTTRVAHPKLLEADKQLGQTAKQAETTAKVQGALNVQKAQADQRVLDETEAERQRLADENQAKKAALQNDLDKGKTYLAEKTKAYASHKITDWFQDQDTRTQVIASLSVGLGDFGAKLAGGENTALRIIEGAVARDRANKLEEREKLLQEKKDAEGDVDKKQALLTAADVELRAQHDSLYRHLEQRRLAALSKFGADQARIDQDKVLIGIREGRAKNQAEMFKGLETIVTKQYRTPDPTSAATGGVNPENIVYGPGGAALFAAPNKQIAQDGNEIIAAYRTIQEESAKLDQLLAGGRTLPGSKSAREMEQHQKAIMLQVKNLEKAGALDKGAVDTIGEMVPAGVGVMGEGRAALVGFRDFLQTKVRTKVDSMGVDGSTVLRQVDAAPAPASTTSAPTGLSTVERARLIRDYQQEKDPTRRSAIARALRASGAAL